jgi:hypothetical protein
MIQPYMYTSATTANEVTGTLNKELQSVLEWVASNKLVLNISKTKSIVLGTNHSLSSRPQLNLVTNSVAVEQVEETKLLGVTIDCKPSWSKDIFNGCKDKGMSVRNKDNCFFETAIHKASPAGPSLIFSLLSIYMLKCCKERPSSDAAGPEQSGTSCFIVIRGQRLILCMPVFLG